jgi:NRPS condensation-like uncharacterized protein
MLLRYRKCELLMTKILNILTCHFSQGKRSTLHAESSIMQADEKTPLIKCMLVYLQYDQLNVREDIIKLFYALSHWGYGIGNKDEFIKKCMPQLIPS